MSEPFIQDPQSRKRSIALKLTILARRLGRRFDQNVEQIGLSRAKFGAIAVVARNSGATQRLIAERLEVSEAAAGRLIERLCQDGYLERRQDPDDRRAYGVFLTSAARPILDRLGEFATTHENIAFAGLDEASLARFEELLDLVSRNVSEESCQPSFAAIPSQDGPPAAG